MRSRKFEFFFRLDTVVPLVSVMTEISFPELFIFPPLAQELEFQSKIG